MKRMNSIRLVGPTIIVLAIIAVGQIVAMDRVDNADFVELQKRIDTGDLAQVRQQVEQKNLKGHLNDQYTCKYIAMGALFEHMPEFKTYLENAESQKRVVNPSDARMDSLYYALDKYRTAVREFVGNGDRQSNYLAIVRYFLQECQATFNKLPDYALDQDFLLIAVTYSDIDAVKLFIQYGMLQLPSKGGNGKEINILAMLKNGTDSDGDEVSAEMKAAYAKMLPYFESRRFSFTAKNMAIVVVVAAIVACGVKKAYDWFSNSSDERNEQEVSEETIDIALSEREQVDPVGA